MNNNNNNSLWICRGVSSVHFNNLCTFYPLLFSPYFGHYTASVHLTGNTTKSCFEGFKYGVFIMGCIRFYINIILRAFQFNHFVKYHTTMKSKRL